METTIENAIRSVARDALTELVAIKEKYPISEHDKHFTEILDRHAKKNHRSTTENFPSKALAKLLRPSD
ncbi:Uncharacterised protein [Yersinia rohdei]|uniref:hypothetical protein n=1 Tax=Yersinia rohdei TaxID=29485 RepID=UPI0005E7B03F|nr:hypothetical protein [Yersinia rohdei]CNJ06786.1 Uncharacterised protein [Yersinia rohdei]